MGIHFERMRNFKTVKEVKLKISRIMDKNFSSCLNLQAVLCRFCLCVNSHIFAPHRLVQFKSKQTTTTTTPISLTTPKLNASTAVLSFPPRTYSSGRYANVPLTVAVRPTVVVCVGEPRGANRARPKSASLAVMWRSSRMLELRKHQAAN